MSEGRQDVEITGFEGDIVISLSLVGGLEGDRTLDLRVANAALSRVVHKALPQYCSES